MRKQFFFYLCFSAIFLAGCNESDIAKLQKENIELKGKIAALESENTKLKETA